MDICDLPNKEIKIAVLKRLKELQENTKRKLSEIRKTIQERNEKYNRDRHHNERNK